MRACRDRNIRGLFLDDSLEDVITPENWEEYATPLAQQKFPVGMLVSFYTPERLYHGEVESISDGGEITVSILESLCGNDIPCSSLKVKFTPDYMLDELTWRAEDYAFSLLLPFEEENDNN